MDFRKVEEFIKERFQVRDRENPDDIVRFKPNPAQHKVLEICQTLHEQKRRLRIISVKSRRVGFSRIVDAIGVCYMFAYANFEGRVMAHYDETAVDILSSVALMAYGDGESEKGVPWRRKREIWDPTQEYKAVVIPHSGKRGSAASRFQRASAKVRGKGRGLGFSFFHGCLAADTGIIVTNGNEVKIADICNGETVLTHGGASANVKQRWSSGIHPTIAIETWMNGDTIRATADHRCFTARGWVKAGDLRLDDEIGVPIMREPERLRHLDLGTVRQPKKGKRLIAGKIELDREFGFFVGHYLAEGWIHNQYKPEYGPALPSSIGLSCHIDEWSFAERSLNAVRPFVRSGKITARDKKAILTLYGGSLAQIMEREFGRKDTKQIPDWVFAAPREFRIGLVLGYVAGDGSKGIDRSAGYENAAISITSIRKRLLVQTRRLIANLGWGYAGLHRKPASIDKRGWQCKEAWCLRINGDAAATIRAEFNDQIVKRADYSTRSELRAASAQKYRLDEGMVWLKIRRLTACAPEPVFDLEIAHDDHSFETVIGAVSNSEAAYYPEDAPFTAVLPALAKSLDRSFASIESTGNGMVGDGEAFYKYWLQASELNKRGDSEWVRVFFGWPDDPQNVSNQIPNDIPRDDEEKVLVKMGLTKQQIAWRRIEIATTYQGNVEEFAVENPIEWKEAFLATGQPAFSREEQDYVNKTVKPPKMVVELERTREPWEIRLAPMGTRGRIKIWELPQPRHEYYLGVDCARGPDMKREDSRPGDYAAINVWNGSTGEQAAAFLDRIDPSKVADIVDMLGRFYKTSQIAPNYGAMLNIEVNANLGAECQRLLRDKLAYPVWRFYRWRGGKDDKYNRRAGTAIGWEMTAASRKLAFAMFRNALRTRRAIVRSEDLAAQICASTMTDGRWEITHGHDDLLVAALLGWVAIEQYPPKTIVPRAADDDSMEVARDTLREQFDPLNFQLQSELSRTDKVEMDRLLAKKKSVDPLRGIIQPSLLGFR